MNNLKGKKHGENEGKKVFKTMKKQRREREGLDCEILGINLILGERKS